MSNGSRPSMTIESGDILRLIEAHLTESGLHQACRVLREESGVSAAGACHSNFKTWAFHGQWGMVLDSLATIDPKRSHMPPEILADVHEMAILELADVGEIDLAFATLRIVADQLDAVKVEGTSDQSNDLATISIPRSRILEQTLSALTSFRASQRNHDEQQRLALPPDYYGRLAKQKRREELGKRLAQVVPLVPPSRLVTLLQQAIKWQSHTGELPFIKKHWEDDEETANDKDDAKKRKRKRRKTEFDIVLGEVEARSAVVGESHAIDDKVIESIPSKPYSTIKFGKKATAECALFFPDATGLVTGSSDGLVEIWDPNQKFSQLRLDLPYQESDDLLWHDTAIMALAISNDGTVLATGSVDGKVKVWKIDNGKCLRQFTAHDGSVVSCLSFSHDASHLLSGSHDTTCREFGLRTSRMLKEFRGHTSFVNACQYVLVEGGLQLRVVTGSADGTVRVWDGKSAEVMHVLRPISLGDTPSIAGASIVMDHQVDPSASSGNPNICAVLPLHTPSQSMIIVPRGSRAFLVTLRGLVVRTYDVEGGSAGNVFVAATISPSNRFLYAVTEDGICCVFGVPSGKLETTIRDFALETSSQSSGNNKPTEVTCLVHHPHKGIVAAFSNDKGQKRGLLTLWK